MELTTMDRVRLLSWSWPATSWLILPEHSILFVFFDAEEMGLQGARAFVNDPPVPLDQFLMNINLDMVSRNEDDELYAVGTYHYPFLTPLVDEVAEGCPAPPPQGPRLTGPPPW
jgi:Zn-dependent M28 family amino/carboxypeptidase